jgi:hypothetical protein
MREVILLRRDWMFLTLLFLLGCGTQKQGLTWNSCEHICRSGLVRGDRPDVEFPVSVTRKSTFGSAACDGIDVSEFRASLCRTLRPAVEDSLSEKFIRVYMECDEERWFIDKYGNVEINGRIYKLDTKVAVPYFEESSCNPIPEWARKDLKEGRNFIPPDEEPDGSR